MVGLTRSVESEGHESVLSNESRAQRPERATTSAADLARKTGWYARYSYAAAPVLGVEGLLPRPPESPLHPLSAPLVYDGRRRTRRR